jgi:hypothetical protein
MVLYFVRNHITKQLEEVNFEYTQTILEVKEHMARITDTKIESIRLIFAGRQLANEYTLQRSNLQKESTIHMIVRLCITIIWNKGSFTVGVNFLDAKLLLQRVQEQILAHYGVPVADQKLFYGATEIIKLGEVTNAIIPGNRDFTLYLVWTGHDLPLKLHSCVAFTDVCFIRN